jgi:uncharacterized protein (TIGR03437 family)
MVVKRLFLGCLILSSCAFAQAPHFTIQDLGSLSSGFPACTATGLSQSGNVTGYCVSQIGDTLLDHPNTHGFLYSNGAMTDLNLNLASLNAPLPMAVNNSGVIAGANLDIDVSAVTVTAEAFIVQQDGSLTLPQGQMQGVLPFALNNAGELVGSLIQVSTISLNLFLNSEAVQYAITGGATSILGAGDAAFGINTSGTVAGANIAQNGAAVSPLLWVSGKSQTLPTLTGYTQSAATSVNDSGAAAGAAFDISFTSLTNSGNLAHAVLFNTNGSVTDLGVVGSDKSSIATGINNSGWVVGFSSDGPPDFTVQLHAILYSPSSNTNMYRAFLYANGTMYDLNTLLTNGTGWSLAYATAINNAGQIIGTGIFLGPNGAEQHAFLLTPATATPGPTITGIAGVAGSVPYVANISSNGLFAIYGNNLASGPAGINSSNIINNELPTNLGGTCVESGTTKWGLFFVSAGQINALAGDIPSTGTVPVSVVTNCGTANEVVSPVMNVSVAAVSPEFLYFVQNASGVDPVAALDFTTGVDVAPAGLIPGFAPAHTGDVIIAYGVGWGATTSTDPIGTLASGAASLTNKYSLTLGGVAVNVSYAGVSPGSAGLYQINFTVPSGVPAGNQPLVLTVDGVPSPAAAYLAVGN